MSKKTNMARDNYLWLRGQRLRTQYPIAWWNGWRAARRDLDNIGDMNYDAIKSRYGLDETAAFESGYEYYKEMYHG